MTPRTTTWSEVAVDSYVQAPDGSVWRVQDERDGQLLLVRPNVTPMVLPRPAPDAPVVVREPSHDEAVAVAERALGAEVIAERQESKGYWTCPPVQHELAAIHHHMFLLHGYHTSTGRGSRSMKIQLDQHREDHEGEIHSHAFIPHIHVARSR